MPAVTSVTLDKPAYNPGQVITCTVAYSASLDFTVTAVAVDIGGHSAQLSGTAVVNGSLSVTDTGGRAWTKVSDDGSTAVFTATA